MNIGVKDWGGMRNLKKLEETTNNKGIFVEIVNVDF